MKKLGTSKKEIKANLEVIKKEQSLIENRLEEIISLLDGYNGRINAYYDEVMASKNDMCNKFDKIYDDLVELHEVVCKLSDEACGQRSEILNIVKRIENHIPNKKKFWNNEFEREIVRSNWVPYYEKEYSEEKYLELIKNLDDKSIQTINKIIIRQKMYIDSDKKYIDLYTLDEQRELSTIEQEFSRQILKVTDDLYAYKHYLLPINHFEASVFWYRHGIELIKDWSFIKNKSIIDVGGFIGDSVLILNDLPHCNIISFEADPNNFKLMKKTIKLNQLESVICENCALGSYNGTVSLRVGGSVSNIVKRAGVNYCETVDVPIITLDDYVRKNRVSVGLIKVDIEGSEEDFLDGAKNVIIEQNPVILLSIYHSAKDFFELKPKLEMWGLSYRFIVYKPTIPNITSETLLFCIPNVRE